MKESAHGKRFSVESSNNKMKGKMSQIHFSKIKMIQNSYF